MNLKLRWLHILRHKIRLTLCWESSNNNHCTVCNLNRRRRCFRSLASHGNCNKKRRNHSALCIHCNWNKYIISSIKNTRFVNHTHNNWRSSRPHYLRNLQHRIRQAQWISGRCRKCQKERTPKCIRTCLRNQRLHLSRKKKRKTHSTQCRCCRKLLDKYFRS